MDVLEAIATRSTTVFYDKEKLLTEAEVKELVESAMGAPSSFNLQNTRFIAVSDPDAKQRLKSVAWNQAKVGEAALTFIVLGDLQALDSHAELMQRAVSQGVIPEQIASNLVKGANDYYGADAQRLHDEALRSGALAAMNLMLAAHAKGLGCGPMIGFDPEAVKKEFGIPDRYLVVMLLAVGYAAPNNPGRKPRRSVDEVLAFNACKVF